MDKRIKLTEVLQNDKRLSKLVERLDAGYGTYEDVSQIAKGLGGVIGDEMAIAYDEDALRLYLTDGHEVVSVLAVTAQQNLNDAARIGMKPLTTKVPKAQIDNLIQSISSVGEEFLGDKVQSAVPSFMMKMVDDISKYNRDFQAKSGMKPIIVRTWSGSYSSHDTRHTDWCADLAGTYEYGKEPKDVYKRHEGCTCTVEYFPNKDAQGRITALAKGEIDREGVLWNTRPDTLSKRLSKLGK